MNSFPIQQQQPNNNFSWDPISAGKKFLHDSTITVGIPGIVSISKKTPHNDPQKDAYRNCSKCHKHWNYHINGKCPK